VRTITTLNTLADNYTYVIDSAGVAVVIDAGEAAPVLRVLERSRAQLLAVMGTHGHFDHIGGNEELARQTGCAVLRPYDVSNTASELTVGSFVFVLMRTPGHSADSVSLLLSPQQSEPGAVFTGDTLFVGGCGRMFTHSPQAMWTSLQSLAALPLETRVFCGHDYALENYEFAVTVEPRNMAIRARLEQIRALVERGEVTVPSTIGQERATNPFFRAVQPEMKQALGMEGMADWQVFARLRQMKDSF